MTNKHGDRKMESIEYIKTNRIKFEKQREKRASIQIGVICLELDVRIGRIWFDENIHCYVFKPSIPHRQVDAYEWSLEDIKCVHIMMHRATVAREAFLKKVKE